MAKRKVAVGDGHGLTTAGKRTPYIKALGRQICENEFNEPVAYFLKEELERNDFDVVMLAPTDHDTPLRERTDKANREKADILLSIHYNAFDGSFGGADPSGFSAHVHSDKYESAKIGRLILKRLAQGTSQKNRGLVVQNLHMTRESNMPAVLLELGFMDNLEEALLMLDENFQRECAREVCQGLCDYYGIEYIPKPAPETKVKSETIGESQMAENKKATGFTDVNADAYYAAAVQKLKEAGIMVGTGKDKFGVGENLKREDFAVALVRALKL